MSRKPKKGYFVRGQFVAEGSELDMELKAELKGTPMPAAPISNAKATELQAGQGTADAARRPVERLGLPDKLVDAMAEAKRITNFEGKRRQMQYVGKLMRKLDQSLVTQGLRYKNNSIAVLSPLSRPIHHVDLPLQQMWVCL
jgi:ribosome-associated protein